jgi:hypothetical protein
MATENGIKIVIGEVANPQSKNELLRCDAMARYTYISKIHRDKCIQCYRRIHGPKMKAPEFLANLSPQEFDNLPIVGSILCNLTNREYRLRKFPAYTIQRRCGAVPAYTWGYVQFASQKQIDATNVNLTSRLHKIRKLNAKRENTDTPSVEPIPYDAVAAARQAVDEEYDVISRRSLGKNRD